MTVREIPELRGVLAVVRDAMERRGDRARSVTAERLSATEIRALADLCGWREIPPGPNVKVSLAELDRALRESAVGAGLGEVVASLFGPLVDRATAKAAEVAARDEAWGRARDAIGHRPVLAEWLHDLRVHGRVARAATLAGMTELALLDRVLAVVARLPARGVLLPVFALDVLGDAHALDPGRPESALVLRAAARLTSVEPPSNAPERRRLWAAVGVACDSLSTDVLTLGLRPVGDGMLARHLREAAARGEPRRTTLRELARDPIALPPGAVVFICENPSVMAAAADRHGAHVHPLVCIEGVASTAALLLLRGLSASGAELRFHVDFDWGGLRIANVLLDHVPTALPWRAGTTDYQEAARERSATVELIGSPVDARWDESLSIALRERGVAVFEEHVLEDLLRDVDGRADSTG